MGVLHGKRLGRSLCKVLDVDPNGVRSVALRVVAKTPQQAPVVVVDGRDAYTLDVAPELLGSFLCSKIGVDPTKVSSLRVVAHHDEVARIEAEILASDEIFDDETFEYLAGLGRAPLEA